MILHRVGRGEASKRLELGDESAGTESEEERERELPDELYGECPAAEDGTAVAIELQRSSLGLVFDLETL